MTGSLIFNRQHSSTAGSSNTAKMARPKLRRCSSADDHNSIEVTPDDNQHKESFIFTRDPIFSEDDSGIEDFQEQPITSVDFQPNNDNEDVTLSGFGPCDDVYVEENLTPTLNEASEHLEPTREEIYNDIVLAANVPDEQKKDFCKDTCEIFHAEFARRISCLIALYYPGCYYHLFAEDHVDSDPCDWYGFHFVRLDNAKAQFKCSNTYCGRLWTSMRARISFKVSQPQPNGFVVLKIFGQACQSCDTPAEALWYPEEVCRVMENLSKEIFMKFFPDMNVYNVIHGETSTENINKMSRRIRHDPNQRKGNMHSQHDSNHCEACRFGWCYA